MTEPNQGTETITKPKINPRLSQKKGKNDYNKLK